MSNHDTSKTLAFLCSPINVDPANAVATQVGQAVTFPSATFIPLSVNRRNLLYVWSPTDFWVFLTDSNGLPSEQPFQHLTSNFAYPVNGFVVDPKGHYAYAVIAWVDANYEYNAEFVLFTVDPTNGTLTNTNRVVATYGPDPYSFLIGFKFGATGRKLWAEYEVSAPFTCEIGYKYYPVQADGLLGTEQYGAAANCGGNAIAIAVTDTLGASAADCCGPGFGSLTVLSAEASSTEGSTIVCYTGMLSLCGDEIEALDFDPTNQNLFVTDWDARVVLITRTDFVDLRLVKTSSSIPFRVSALFLGIPKISVSPDARLVYALYPGLLRIYGFAPDQGELTVSTTMPVADNATIVLTRLYN